MSANIKLVQLARQRGHVNIKLYEVESKLSLTLIPASLTPQKPPKNQPRQHFWLNRFLGRWLKGEAV